MLTSAASISGTSEGFGRPMSTTRKSLIKKNKLLARGMLYGVPLLLVTAATLFIRYADPDRMVDRSWAEVDYESIESVQVFRDLLRIDTTYPSGSEIEAADYLAGLLEAEGIFVEVERFSGRYANLKALIRGKDPRPLVLHSHLDADPVRRPERWRHPPFSAAIELPFVYGRGAFDMKSITAAQVMAMLEVKRSGKMLKRSLMLLATSDEERDSWVGTRRLLKENPQWSKQLWAVLTEGGAVEAIDIDNVRYWGTEFGQKRFVDIWVCDDNLSRLEDLRSELHDRELPRRLEPEIARFLPHYQPSRDRLETRDVLSDPDRLLERLRTYPVDVGPTVLPPYIDAMLRSRISVFPPEPDPEGGYLMRVILHLLPSDHLHDVMPKLVGDRLEGFTYKIEEVHPPVKASDFDHPAFQRIDEFMAKVYPEFEHGPLFIPYSATDSRYFRQYGIPSFGFSPFLILSGDSMKMRGVDERMPLPAFVAGSNLYQGLVESLVLEDAR